MIQSWKANDPSEALEMWSLIKTSLQFKHVNFRRCAHTHTLLLLIHGCFLQMKMQCKPQNCCSLKELTFSIAENPNFPHQQCWWTNFPWLSWVYQDGEQTITGLEIRNEQSTALCGTYKPKGHLQLQPLPSSLKTAWKMCLFSQGTANCLSLPFTLSLQLQLIFISLMQEHCATASGQRQSAALHLMQIPAATCYSRTAPCPCPCPSPTQQTGAAATSSEPDKKKKQTDEPKKGASPAQIWGKAAPNNPSPASTDRCFILEY